jgi:hypothetical protein
VIVAGSQSILGTFREDQLPADATRSVEIDILPIAGNSETKRLADLIEGVAGEFSPFEELHGFSIDGVDLSMSALPTGWRGRLVKVQNAIVRPLGSADRSAEWVGDPDACVVLTVAHVLGEDLDAVHRPGCLDDRGVPVGKLEPLAGIERCFLRL